MTETRTLILVDGSSYLYRAFHALPPLSNSRGEPTGAVLGVLNMLLKLVKETPHGLMAVVFDASGRTFRDDLFAEYKANRTPMPDELRAQVAPLIDAVEALGLPLLRVDGVEADDVIGTLACQASADGIRVIISTGDKDMAQLVDERISLVNTMSDTSLDRAGVKAKFDVYPEQIIDYLALVGDTSDNIPGVPKVGPKTAAKWLNEYQTLDALLANQDRIEGKVGENLRSHSADVALSRALATINTTLELAVKPPDLVPRERDVARLRALYTRLELRSLLRQLPGADAVAMAGGRADVDTAGVAPAATATVTDADSTASTAETATFPPPVERHYETVLDATRLDAWLRDLERAAAFALAVETTPHDQMQASSWVSRSPSSPGASPMCRSRTIIPARRCSSSARTCCRSCGRCSRMRRATRSCTTARLPRTSCVTTASNCVACASTRCSSRTCSTARRRGTTSIRRRGCISVSRLSPTTASPAAAPNGSHSTTCRSNRARRTQRSMRISHCSCTVRCGPGSKQYRRCGGSMTRSSSLSRTCCSTWSMRAC